ncbi:MAG: protein kinase [Acidobacteriota bacterium]
MRTTNSDLPIPERIDRFRILGRLGRGGMGDVLLAEDERLGRQVAIKRLRGDFDDVDRRRFEREARAIARLSHPAIVRLFEVLDMPTGQHLVLERVDGETLATRIRRGPLPVDEVIALGGQIAEGLAEAHANGLLHRDLKSENVMITRLGHVKVLDLGLVTAVRGESELEASRDDSLTPTGVVLGTIRAMSPEQASGAPLDARSDLFALGVLLYEALTGVSPFRGGDRVETLSNLLGRRARPVRDHRPEAPPALAGLVESLIEKDPNRRPRTAHDVVSVLGELARTADVDATTDRFGDAVTGRAPTVASPLAEATRVKAPTTRWRPAWSWGVALVLLFVVLGGVTLWRPDPTPLRVAFLEPEVVGESSELLELVAAATRDASLQALSAIPGVEPLAPDDLRGVEGTPQVIANAHAADEVLIAKVVELVGTAHIELRRVEVDDGRIAWSQRIPVSLSPDDTLQTATAVDAQLRRSFATRRTERGSGMFAPSAVEPDDYREFLALQNAVRHGNLPYDEAIEQARALVDRSPRLVSAHWLLADLAETLYSDQKRPEDLALARRHLKRARELSPEDTRPLVHAVRLALLAEDLETAATALVELERIAPGDAETLYQRALLARARGETMAAIVTLRRLVERHPSWRYLYLLATIESRAGELPAARRHLHRLLEVSPDNSWGLNALVQWELLHGDLEAAERLAVRLLELKEHRSYWTNLGIARFLLGRYDAARNAYQRALELDADHPTVLLNLADTLTALGRDDAAMHAYRHARDVYDRFATERPLTISERIALAQCLAHLGVADRAVEITMEALARGDDDAELAYQAAVVFSVVGDRTSARIKARRALDLGMDERWFRIPQLAGLLDELES